MDVGPVVAFAAAVAIAAAVVYQMKFRKQATVDAVVPAPASPRADLLVGFFDALGDQLDKTLPYVNSVWLGDNAAPRVIEYLKQAQRPAILHLTGQLWDGVAPKYALSPNAEARLRAYLKSLADAEVLRYVVGLVPVDEPLGNVSPVSDVVTACELVRRVAAEFPELATVKLVGVGVDPNPEVRAQFDVWGLDPYDKKSGWLTDGTYERIRALLRPDQRTALIPGGSCGQDPAPYVNFALDPAHAEVWGVWAFVWFEGAGCPAISTNGMGPAYEAAFRRALSI